MEICRLERFKKSHINSVMLKKVPYFTELVLRICLNIALLTANRKSL